jgi:hypothetical protein
MSRVLSSSGLIRAWRQVRSTASGLVAPASLTAFSMEVFTARTARSSASRTRACIDAQECCTWPMGLVDHDDAGLLGRLPGGFAAGVTVHLLAVVTGAVVAGRARAAAKAAGRGD